MYTKRMLSTVAAAILSVAAAMAQEWAVTCVSANYMRSEPDYESPLETQTLMGAVMQAGPLSGRWLSVCPKAPHYDNVWVNSMTVARMDDAQLEGYIAAEKYICTAPYSQVTDMPVGGNVVCDLVMGDLVRKVFNDRGKAIHTVTHAKVMLPDGRTGYVRYGDLNDFKSWLSLRNPSGADIVSTAHKFTGVPYLWGGNSVKGMDCSGLVWLTYYMNGILLPRNASQMALAGVDVPLQSLMTGDLIFFGNEEGRINHVGIYTGEAGVIHSSQMVYEGSIDPGSPYYLDRQIVCARRILGHLKEGAVKISDSPWFVHSDVLKNL